MRRIIAGAVVLLLAAACSSGGDDSSTTTTAPTTTLPQSQTTTSLPPRSVTAADIDVCSWLHENELETVLEDPGAGVPTVTMPDEDEPSLFTGQCAWPDTEHPAMTLHYLAPTTAESGQQHLQDVLNQETEVFAGGTVLPPVDVNEEPISFLADADGMVREAAVVKRSALLYLIIDQEVDARDAGALDPYAELLYKALVRAPR
jgi:hypothetical protein